MNNRLVISRFALSGQYKEAVVTACLKNNKLTQLDVENEQEDSLLGEIYVGKVSNIVKNIHAAFISVGNDNICYYSLDELENAVFTDKKGKKPITVGDELLVQVVKERAGTKAPTVTTNLSITGKYVVLSTGKKDVGVSAKLSAETREELRKQFLNVADERFGLIIRTSAAEAEYEDILAEYNSLSTQLAEILEKGKHATCFSIIYAPEDEYIKYFRNENGFSIDEIVTDREDIFNKLTKECQKLPPDSKIPIRFYQDSLLPLYKLYNLPKQIEEVLRKKVWLKSGAYLIIERTEACTVIDVNTGKCDTRKNFEQTFLNINREAAEEIARQLQLRNLSGIILVDFINMKDNKMVELLMSTMQELVLPDKLKTTVVDITPLGIVEITRQKKRCTLEECFEHLKIE